MKDSHYTGSNNDVMVDRKCWPGIGNRQRSWGWWESWYGCGWGSKLGVGGSGMVDVCGGIVVGAGDGVCMSLGWELMVLEGS